MIIVDAFGGDNAPDEIVKGAVMAVEEYGIELTLVGDEEKINNVFKENSLPNTKINIIHANEVINFDEESARAVRKKKNSSIVVGATMLKENENSVFVSAGSTGALLAAGVLVTGRIKAVKRPALGAVLPAKEKPVLLMDCGANADVKAEFLNQFAVMSTVYMESVMGITNPTVGLVNIGTEDTKGSTLYKEAFGLLKANNEINFIGNIESKEIMFAPCDIIIADGFTGNIILKLIEGMGAFFKDMLKEAFYSSAKSKLGAMLLKDSLSNAMSGIDSEKYGGAPLLGVDGGIIKAHGSAKALGIKNAINQAILFKENEVLKKIKKNLS